ncbi:MAG: hypothetical protein AAGJ35_01450 [Myxococcota bacterium]
MRHTWLRRMLGIPEHLSKTLELCIHTDDTVLCRALLSAEQSFHIGRSIHNDFTLHCAELPMDVFTLVYVHQKGPLIQFTSTMRGYVKQLRRWRSLESLKRTHWVHPTPQGYRMLLPYGSSLILHLEQLEIHFGWSAPPSPWMTAPGIAKSWLGTSLHNPLSCPC